MLNENELIRISLAFAYSTTKSFVTRVWSVIGLNLSHGQLLAGKMARQV